MTTQRDSRTSPQQYSIYAVGSVRADEYKWIESEKRGHDIGPHARVEWFRKHWPRFCLACRLEHIRGENFWQEFEEESFGRFYDEVVSGDEIINEILDLVAEGWENLNILFWASDQEICLEHVFQILLVVNMNQARLDPLDD